MKKTILLLTMLCTVLFAAQCLAYSVSLTPQSQIVNLGETATVDVNLLLNPGEELFGFNFALTFDPAIVQFKNLVFNSTQLQDYVTGYTAPSAQYPDLVTFDGALFGLTGITSNITPLASLNFTALAVGTSPLNLSGTVLDFNGISEIPLSATGSIAPVPEPLSCILIGSGLAGVACLRRKLA